MKTLSLKIELKPCPFCGGYANLMYDQDVALYSDFKVIETIETERAYIQCSRCGAETHYAPAEQAIRHWNTRIEVTAPEA